MVRDRLNQLLRQLFRVEIVKANPPDAFHFGEVRREICKGRATFEIAAIRDGVLADETDFDHPRLREQLDFLANVLDLSRALFAAEARDGAERARTVATFGDLHERAVAAVGKPAWVGRAHCEVGGISHHHSSALFAKNRPELQHVGRAQEVIHLGHLVRKLGWVTLREAPGDDEALAASFALHLRHLEDRIDALLFGSFDEATRIDDDHLGIFRGSDVLIPFEARDPEHDLRVDLVFGAAKRNEMNRGHSGELAALGAGRSPKRGFGHLPGR